MPTATGTAVLTLALVDEHRVFEEAHIQTLIKEGEQSAENERVRPDSTKAGVPLQWLRESPKAWSETGGPGFTKHQTPIYVELKPGATPLQVKQYPLSPESLKAIGKLIKRLREAEILRVCQSSWNTPLLPIKKADGV